MNYLDYFKEICAIPHVSHHTEGICRYLIDFARAKGLDYRKDESGNVIITKPASSAGKASLSTVVLQAHVDMVGVSVDGRDMSNEPVRLAINGDRISAEGSSLGADNGIGLCYILDVLSDDSLISPRIQAIFTVDEEVGMVGMKHLDFSSISGRHVINLDSESEDEVVVSSAGGVSAEVSVSIRESAWRLQSGTLAQISVFGLPGGHSGNQIHKGRANAIMSLASVLSEISDKHDARFVSLCGGDAANAIPSSATVEVLYCGADFESFRRDMKSFLASYRRDHIKMNPGFDAEIVWKKESRVRCLSAMNSAFFKMLSSFPDGMLEADESGNALTSLNFGVAAFDKDSRTLKLDALLRSNADVSRNKLADDIRSIAEGYGDASDNASAFSCSIAFSGEYGAWQRREGSPLLEYYMSEYEREFGKSVRVVSTHGGLECGFFAQNIPDCDLISIGPEISNIHSVHESASVASCDRVLDLLKRLLENWRL